MSRTKENKFDATVTWELMEEPPEFPCLFVPITMFGTNGWKYQWQKAFITECKIRGAGHYFKISTIYHQSKQQP